MHRSISEMVIHRSANLNNQSDRLLTFMFAFFETVKFAGHD